MASKHTWHLFHAYKDANKGFVLNAKTRLTQRQVDSLMASRAVVAEFIRSQNVSRAVYANRDEILQSLVAMAKEYMDGVAPREALLEDGIFHMSRRFANTCSLFRSFLDHTDRYFVHVHGKQSPKYKLWKAALADLYDNTIAYPLVYLMRNFIQHHDMPPLSLSISEAAGKKGISVDVHIDVPAILDDVDIKRKLGARISHLETVPLLNVLDEWSRSLDGIISMVNAIRLKDVVPHARKIENLRARFSVPQNGRLAMAKLPVVKQKPEKLDVSLIWFPEDKAQTILDAARKNPKPPKSADE
jgi:hypothetical protein